MWLFKSIKVALVWALFICIISQNMAEGNNDEDFKNDLLHELQKLRSKVDNMGNLKNDLLLDIQNTLAPIQIKVDDIDYKVDALTDRLFDGKERLETTKLKVESMGNDLLSIQNALAPIHTKVEDTNNRVEFLGNGLYDLFGKHKYTQHKVEEVKEIQLNITRDIFLNKQLAEEVKQIQLNMTEEVKEIKVNVSKDSLHLIQKVDEIETTIEDKHQEIIQADEVLLNTVIMRGLDRCPGGIFVSTRCYRAFLEEKYSYEGAKDVCSSNNLILAESSSETIASPLRRFLLERYGEKPFWINKVNSTHFEDQLSRTEFTNGAQLSHCLALHVTEDLELYSEQPYRPARCEEMLFPLCERPLQNTETLPDPILDLSHNISTQLNTMMKGPVNELMLKTTSIEETLDNNRNQQSTNMATKFETLETKISDKFDEIDEEIDGSNNILNDIKDEMVLLKTPLNDIKTSIKAVGQKQVENVLQIRYKLDKLEAKIML